MAVIPKYVSNTQKDFKIGVDNYSEDKLSLQIIGNVGIGTTSFEDPVSVANTAKLAVGIATAHQVFTQILSFTSGVGPNTTGQSTVAGANIAIGDTFTGNTFNNAVLNYRNISIGNCAGCCLNNGAKNVFIGDQAGRNITDGMKNVVIGETAVGGNSFSPSATGDENFIVGDSAGFNLTSGSHNIMFGDQTGGFTSTGGCNIMIGRRSGGNNQTGNCNIILGNLAGYVNGNGSDNIFIGTCAQGARCNPSKTLVIGHFNHQWIHGDSNYSVGIGITNPSIAVVGAGDTQKLAVGILSAYNIFSNQLNITGVSTFNGTVDLNAGLDIDGQLDVDELVVAGVSTFNNTVDINSTLDVDGDTQLDDLTVAGFATFTSNASFAGNVSIAGTLTYEDVTNIDAIGIVTAGNGLRITQGGINVNAGISTFGGNIDADGNLDVDGTTDLDVLNVAETATFSALVDANNRLDVVGGANIDQLNISGVTTFKDDVEFHGVLGVSSITFDKSDNSLKFKDNARLRFGNDNRLQIYYKDNVNYFMAEKAVDDIEIGTHGGDIIFETVVGAQKGAEIKYNSSVDLYYKNIKRLATSGVGATIFGQLDTTDLNVAGVSTFAGITTVTGETLFTKQLSVSGVSTFADDITVQKNMHFGDSPTGTENLLSFGAGDDLSIFHSGNGSFIRDSGTGSLTILTNQFLVRNAGNNEELIEGFENSSVSLFFNGIKRLSTTGIGASVLGQLDSTTLNVSGVGTFAGDINANGNIVGDTSTNISGINSVTATSFFGDGSGLENTGATLSAASGSQRLVLTSLTSGTMTSAATDADLAFNATSNLLSAGKLNVVGLTTISNLKVDSGIVTAASGIATYNGDLVIGTPSAGFKSGAFTINTTDKTKDSINELNFILGKLVPDPPDTINGVSFTLSGLGNGRLCAGFTPVNNTGGSHAVAAGRQYSRNTDSTVTSNTLTEFGPGDSETVTGFVNAVGVGTVTLTVGNNNDTYDKLQILNNEDAANSSRNPGITSQFYEIYDARLLNAPSPDGFNKAFISQGISTTTSAFWYEDPSTVSAPVISFSPVTYPASPTLSYSSGIPHYTQASANAFTYALGVENASGDMYTQNTFVSSDGQTSGFQNPGNKSYTNFTGGTNPPAQNYGVGAAVTTQVSQQPRDLHLTATSNVFTSFDASTPYGSHNNQRVGFTTDVNIMGTTARTNKIDEDNILITSLGTGSGNATRVNAGSTGDNPSPVFTAWGGGSAGSIATYEATVRGAVLRHDQEDYSDGTYLPVGPDYSAGRSGTQYFQIELIRSNVSEFSISYTGSVAGCFICMPQNSAWTTSLSGTNGWADMFQAYKGSGIPTSAEPGCSSGGLMDNNGGTFTCVFGTESSSNDTGNRILIRWKLTSGQSITAMSFTST